MTFVRWHSTAYTPSFWGVVVGVLIVFIVIPLVIYYAAPYVEKYMDNHRKQ